MDEWDHTGEVFNLDNLTAADLFGVGPEDGHDACFEADERRTDAVTRALEEHVEPCFAEADPVAERWIAVVEYTRADSTAAVRLHTSHGLTEVDVQGLLQLGREST